MRPTVDGADVYVYTGSRSFQPAQRAVMFVHGAAHDHSVWALQSRYFAHHGWNVLAVDLPGHGRSAGAPLPSIGEMADWIFRMLDSQRIQHATLVGHSMGSLVALECAARQPARVERIALIGTAYPMKVGEAFLDAAKRNDQAAYDMETIWGHAPQVPLGGNPNPGMWMYGDMLARLERLAPGVLYNDLNACNSYAGGEAAAAKVKCPALFILGRRDQMTVPKAGQAFAQMLPGAKVVQIAPSGHSLMAESPDATLDALIEFLHA